MSEIYRELICTQSYFRHGLVEQWTAFNLWSKASEKVEDIGMQIKCKSRSCDRYVSVFVCESDVPLSSKGIKRWIRSGLIQKKISNLFSEELVANLISPKVSKMMMRISWSVWKLKLSDKLDKSTYHLTIKVHKTKENGSWQAMPSITTFLT